MLFGLLAFRGYGNWLGTKPTDQSPALTDLNRADRAELEQVPGIGPGLAKQIDDHRRAKGPFQSVDELRHVKGIGPMTLDKVRPFFRVEPRDATRPHWNRWYSNGDHANLRHHARERHRRASFSPAIRRST